MSWFAFIYYPDRIDEIGGNDTDHEKELHYKIRKFAKKNCQKVEVFRNNQTIFPEGIKLIKKNTE